MARTKQTARMSIPAPVITAKKTARMSTGGQTEFVMKYDPDTNAWHKIRKHATLKSIDLSGEYPVAELWGGQKEVMVEELLPIDFDVEVEIGRTKMAEAALQEYREQMAEKDDDFEPTVVLDEVEHDLPKPDIRNRALPSDPEQFAQEFSGMQLSIYRLEAEKSELRVALESKQRVVESLDRALDRAEQTILRCRGKICLLSEELEQKTLCTDMLQTELCQAFIELHALKRQKTDQ